MKLRFAILAAIVALAYAFMPTAGQDKQPKKEVIPHAQDKMPGPPLSPQEALKKMQVPPGFRVELVAAEPDIVNPVAMTFDERGRIWITESLEYPKKAAGPGKDRVKVLESTKGDGKFDKVSTVIDGLNIPSGIAVGHGGVWVANAPDILYYPFEDFATPKLGKPQVVVTGFGRFDTHELPNSLTWGPDGYLYGLNGVFNRSVVKQDGKTFDFTCALFRIHPKTKKFELFCEGTSNPWGLAFNDNGDAFVSACVIDHLWHLTETGYYHRQGGAYPPFTWKIGSIVKHKHQKAAYCGLVWFDSDAYPPEYREKLYMGNIHGNCINADELTRDGSTYAGKPRPDFLSANDAWFMPVAQKVGPDGCMYILDWYDRYHCYQDANRDPAGIDRLKGRLYRVVYKDYKPAGLFDLQKEEYQRNRPVKDDRPHLIDRLGSPNVYFRETAQRVLSERLVYRKGSATEFEPRREISGYIYDDNSPRKKRLHAMWTTISLRNTDALLMHKDPTIRAWAVRAAGNEKEIDLKISERIIALATDPSADVQLQVAIAARKLKGVDPLPILLDVLTHCGDDKLIPHIVWQNLHPLLEKDGERFLNLAAKVDLAKSPGVAKVLPRAIDRILGNASGDPAAVVKFVDKLATEGKSASTANLCVAALSVRIQSGELAGKQLENLKMSLSPEPTRAFSSKFVDVTERTAFEWELALLQVTMGYRDPGTVYAVVNAGRGKAVSERLRALDAMVAGRSPLLDKAVGPALALGDAKDETFRGKLLGRLGKVADPWVAEVVLKNYPDFNGDEQAKAIELLTQRPTWAKSLFQEIGAKRISKDLVNVNQARRLLATKDKELAQLIEKHWGIPRTSRDPEREKIAAEMKVLFTKTPGDAKAGALIYKKVCGQCHKIHGEGVDVGPDITLNGRADFDQLLSNIFDPSLVIGSGYQSVTVNTKQGVVINGLVVEDNAQRIVLKVQGGELKTIARQDVDEQFTSKLSMMPEDVEKQLRPQEIVDLLSYLSFDRSPADPKARKIAGTPR